MKWYDAVAAMFAALVKAIAEAVSKPKATPAPIEAPSAPGFSGIDADEDHEIAKRRVEPAPPTPRNVG